MSTAVTTEDEMEALPVGSVVRATWELGHPNEQTPYTMTRCPEGGASVGGWGLASGEHWRAMANWGATLTVIYRATA